MTMAFGTIPPPGTTFGPCIDSTCAHKDCEQSRVMAKSTCRYCGNPIGFDTRFSRDPSDTVKYMGSEYDKPENQHWVHWSCLASGS